MFIKFLIISFVIKYCLALQIKYHVGSSSSSEEQNVSATDINPNTVNSNITWLYLLKYNKFEEHVETISDLPDLQHVNIYGIGQEIIPTFSNLPKIRHVSVTGNGISFIKTEALGNIPAEEIYLYSNNISRIESRGIGPNVKILYLPCNKLTKFIPRWFKNASNLEELDMAGNLLTELQKNAFKDFINLQQIVLSYNRIKTIQAGALANRNNFYTLYLANNQLLQLPVNAFQEGQIEIQSIHLQNNRLSFLPMQFLAKTNQTKARIYGNPWQCACWDLLRQWNSWVNYEYNKEPEGAPRCVTPLSFQDSCIEAVDFESIKYYEENAPAKETRNKFCETYLH